VTVKHDGRRVEAYTAYPEVANKAPVVLVIHEIFRLSDWAQLVTDKFAEAGTSPSRRICCPERARTAAEPGPWILP